MLFLGNSSDMLLGPVSGRMFDPGALSDFEAETAHCELCFVGVIKS